MLGSSVLSVLLSRSVFLGNMVFTRHVTDGEMLG